MTLEYIDARGNILPLTNSPYFQITNIDGLTSCNVEISTSTIMSMDGDIETNKRALPRNIIIDFAIEYDVDENIRQILKYIKPKQNGKIRMIKDNKTRIISGTVQSIEAPRFSSLVTLQMVFYCSTPYWEDEQITAHEISEVLNLNYYVEEPTEEDTLFYFTEEGEAMGEYDINRTKVFENDGHTDVELEIRIIALGRVKNPVLYNSKGEYIGVNIEMTTGDEIIITTHKGKKNITLNGKKILGKIKRGSTWLTLPTGEEEYTIDSEDDTEANMYFTIFYKQRYI